MKIFPTRFRLTARSGIGLTLALALIGAGLGHETNAKSAKSAKSAKTTTSHKIAPKQKPAETLDFAQSAEVREFVDQMVGKHDFQKAELLSVFGKMRYIDTTVELMKPVPAGRTKNWRSYRNRFIEPVRINAGIKFWNEHAQALARAESEYGVPAEIIIGILGVETIFGRNAGKFRVLDVIATLAFAYPNTPTRKARMTFFRSELENTLLYARESAIDPFSLQGSYAGAIGLPQFMPSNIRKYAIDFDGDGKIDLRNSPDDAIGSIANYLTHHGWRRGEPIVFPTAVSAGGSDGNGGHAWSAFLGQSLEAKFKPEELSAAGVSIGLELPTNLSFGLVDLQNGADATEYWLGANNFFAITQYNRSFFYAMSVIDLGDAIRKVRNR